MISTEYVTFHDEKLQKKFKHAGDFGVRGACNAQNISEWRRVLESHVLSSRIKEIKGSYRGKPVIHLFDPTTSLNVICTEENIFISAWKLSTPQVEALFTTGKLGGGK
jgi:hypothetical protein